MAQLERMHRLIEAERIDKLSAHSNSENENSEKNIKTLSIFFVFLRWPFIFGALFFSLSALYLHANTPKYLAEIKITPSESSRGSLISDGLESMGGLASLAGLSLKSTSTASPFELYLNSLRSREIANELANDERIMHTFFADNWDAERKAWIQPKGMLPQIKYSLKNILGVPATRWSPPGAQELQKILMEEIDIYESSTNPVTRVQFAHKDSDFAVYFLQRLHEATDNRVRADALKQANAFAAHLTHRLRNAHLPEHREALAEALMEQERAIMMASSSIPYAAKPLGSPTTPNLPTLPSAKLVLTFGLMLGIFLGTLVALTDFNALRTALRSRIRTKLHQ